MTLRKSMFLVGVLFVVAVLLAPTEALAQAGIAGVARDETGAVMPGVTVEAASPVLIEKVRVVYTDSTGLYRINDLRPGQYSVTFSLAGFSTFRRDGITLSGTAVATVNGEMRVGAIEETLTVTGEAPLVDVQSTTKEQVLNKDLLEAIPTGRQVWTVGFTLPGVTLNGSDVGGAGGIQQERIGAHGAGVNQTTVEIDGMIVNANHQSGGTQQYFNDGVVQEMAFQTSGNSAETQKGGVRLNMIPETGGNLFSGSVIANASPNSGWQSSNYTEELRKAGLPAAPQVKHLHDYSANQGGPINRDSMWWFASFRHIASNVAGTDAIDPSTGERSVTGDWIRQHSGRVTWQATTQHKLTAFFERDRKVTQNTGGVGDAFEALNGRPARDRYYDIAQAKWTGSMSPTLLLETGMSFSGQNWTQECQPGVNEERGTPAWFRKVSRQDIILGTRWSACASNSLTRSARQTLVSSASYITGSHSLKTGVQWGFGPRGSGRWANGDLVQRYRTGVPDSVIVYNTPNNTDVYMDADLGVYVQDSWKLRKLTLNPGARLDYFRSSAPAQHVVAGRFFGERNYAAVNLPTFLDLSPRFGLAYDIFGDGKTAIKGGINRYADSMAGDFPLGYSPSTNASETRNWTDLNNDDLAQENEIAASQNSNFGIAAERRPDPDLKRSYNIEYNVSLDRQLLPGLSASIGYYRRTQHNISAGDNLKISLADYRPRTLVSPLDGKILTVYDQIPTVVAVETLDRNFDERKEIYNGVEATFQLRTPGNGRIVGGLTRDRARTLSCSVDNPNSNTYCDEFALDLRFRNLFKLTGSYPLPFGIQLAGSFTSSPGDRLTIGYSVGRALLPGLTQSSVTVPLIAPGTQYRDQVNQLDFSFAKNVPIGGPKRLRFAFNLFNALNSSVVLGSNTTWGPNLGQPTSIIQGRLMKGEVQFHY